MNINFITGAEMGLCVTMEKDENLRGDMSRNRPGGGERSGPNHPVASKSRQIKLVLLGESGVGKSSIALRYVRGEFNENGEATIGAAYLTKNINLQSTQIKFDIWDTAGQERYHSLAPMYYRGAAAAIVVYDVCSSSSFMRAQQWVKELIQQANSQIVICIVGNKADMAGEKRAISKEEGQEFAMSNNLIFSETSAKTGMNIDDIFFSVANRIAAQSPGMSRDSDGNGGKNVRLNNKKNNNGGGGCCS